MTSPENTDHKPGDRSGEISEGPSAFQNAEVAQGGADAVPGTPDATPSSQHGDPAGATTIEPQRD
jgi:hypothetical protein